MVLLKWHAHISQHRIVLNPCIWIYGNSQWERGAFVITFEIGALGSWPYDQSFQFPIRSVFNRNTKTQRTISTRDTVQIDHKGLGMWLWDNELYSYKVEVELNLLQKLWFSENCYLTSKVCSPIQIDNVFRQNNWDLRSGTVNIKTVQCFKRNV